MGLYRQTRIRNNLLLRARLIQAVRQYFIQHDYLEVDTPCRIPVPIPEAHIEAEASGSLFLQTSPEICMKPLLAAGFEKIFQICKCFRKNERGRRHLPEMSMLEWYAVGMDYDGMMTQCEKLIQFVAAELGLNGPLCYQNHQIDLNSPWHRLSVSDAFDRYATMSMNSALASDCFDQAMVDEIEPHLGLEKPVFLLDYPAEHGSLAKAKPDNPELAQRFELYIASLELCNGFTELTDSAEQRRRFEKERRLLAGSGKTLPPMPEMFLSTLDDLPDAAGNALGIDRLVMLFADAPRIDDVVAFLLEEL